MEIQKEEVRRSKTAATLMGMLMTQQELEDATQLHYSRVLWKNPRTRRRLLYVWEHPRHPSRERFKQNYNLIAGLLESQDPRVYVDSLASTGKWSLQTLTREIPSMIWEFWDDSKELAQK